MEKPNERRPSTKIQWHPAFCAAAELELRFNVLQSLGISKRLTLYYR